MVEPQSKTGFLANRKLFYAAGIIVLLVAIAAVFAVIYIDRKCDRIPETNDLDDSVDEPEQSQQTADEKDDYIDDFPAQTTEEISKQILEGIDGDRIKAYLRKLTQKAHIAGTKENKAVADMIQQMWTEAGLEDVHQIPYNVLLSYPVDKKPNRVFIHSANGEEQFASTGYGQSLRAHDPNVTEVDGSSIAHYHWLAYSAPGIVTGEVVYCNYGDVKDFKHLKSKGISVKGRIALMRLGSSFRGHKVFNAEKWGAIGAILFSDPEIVAPNGTSEKHVYPHTIYMPSEGVQRGNIKGHHAGDPLTQLYPSKEEMFIGRELEHIDEKVQKEMFPSIPALPVSYATAKDIFKVLGGEEVIDAWRGIATPGKPYRYGGEMLNNVKVTVEVNSVKEKKKIQNVVGYIKGSKEPDRYVILGNHFDAWTFGSMDPNSGTAILAEIAHSMMTAVNKTGWRPARTIMFTAWDAEEYGLIGSTEFVEEFAELLRQRAVVYLNMDCVVANETLHVDTTAQLFNVTIEVAKRIRNPSKDEIKANRTTLYDTWLFKSLNESEYLTTKQPKIPIPTGRSDHASFLNYVGVPVVDFTYQETTWTFPLYHSLYETPFLSESLIDTDGFSVHVATGQYWAELARVFADDVILPMNLTDFATELKDNYLDTLNKRFNDEVANYRSEYTAVLNDTDKQLEKIEEVAEIFLKSTKNYEKDISSVRSTPNTSPMRQHRLLASINERIMMVDRCFINDHGASGNPHQRHVLYSVSSADTYSGAGLSVVHDSIDSFTQAAKEGKLGKDDITKKAREIAFQISVVQHSIHCAISVLSNRI